MRLDRDVDWGEVAGVALDAYRVVAPKRLLAQVSESPDGPSSSVDDADS